MEAVLQEKMVALVAAAEGITMSRVPPVAEYMVKVQMADTAAILIPAAIMAPVEAAVVLILGYGVTICSEVMEVLVQHRLSPARL
jgi:hypothetical protein